MPLPRLPSMLRAALLVLAGASAVAYAACVTRTADDTPPNPPAPAVPQAAAAVAVGTDFAGSPEDWTIYPDRCTDPCSLYDFVPYDASTATDAVGQADTARWAQPGYLATPNHKEKVMYAITTATLPELYPFAGPAERSLEVSLEYRQHADNTVAFESGTPLVTVSVSLLRASAFSLASPPPLDSLPELVPLIRASDGAVVERVSVQSSQTAWHQLVFEPFRTASVCLDCRVLLTFEFGNRVKNPGSVHFIGDFALQQAAIAQIPPRSTHHVSELPVVSIPTMPALATAGEPRSACPHVQADRPTGETLRDWHDASTWPSGSVPAAGSDVTLPAGTVVIIRSCSLDAVTGTPFGTITVPEGSTLVLDDGDMTLEAHSIVVHGHLQAGSATCRLFSRIEIVLHGSKPAQVPMPAPELKGIVARGSGTIDIHGKEYYTWARLAQTVFPGDRHATLQAPVNWEAGQRVVLVTSIWMDEEDNQNEILTVSTVDASGLVVWFETPVKHIHFAGEEYQTEIGLLSRRIVVRGNEADSVADQYGGHIMVADQGIGRFSGVAAVHMGQRNFLGRYPFHFHLIQSSPDSFVRDCAIERAFFRCVVVHGTHNATVENNVAFDVDGHCYYLEDGVEEDNAFRFNLAAFVHTIFASASGTSQAGEIFKESLDLINPADTSAAGFYISNAHNRFVGNVASGGWAGFAFPNLPLPIGHFRTHDYSSTFRNPENRNILEFEGNTAHSSSYQWNRGGCVYIGGELRHTSDGTLRYQSGRIRRETLGEDGSNEWMIIRNLLMFMCTRGLNHWGTRSELHHVQTWDTKRSAVVFGEAYIYDAQFGGRSRNSKLQELGLGDNLVGFRFYDTNTKTILDNVTFINYEKAHEDRVIAGDGLNDKFSPEGINAVRNIRYINCPDSILIDLADTSTGASWIYNIVDEDGTASLRPGTPTIIGSHRSWWNYDSEACAVEPLWGNWVCDKGDREIVSMDLIVVGVTDMTSTDSEEAHTHTGYISNMRDPEHTRLIRTRNPTVTGVSKDAWLLQQFNGSPRELWITDVQVPRNQFFVLAIPYPAGSTFNIFARQLKRQGPFDHPIREAQSLAEIMTSDETLLHHSEVDCDRRELTLCDMGTVGAAWFFDGTHLYVRIVDLVNYASKYYADADRLFNRSGIIINDIDKDFEWHIEVECSERCADNDACFTPDSSSLPPLLETEDLPAAVSFCGGSPVYGTFPPSTTVAPPLQAGGQEGPSSSSSSSSAASAPGVVAGAAVAGAVLVLAIVGTIVYLRTKHHQAATRGRVATV